MEIVIRQRCCHKCVWRWFIGTLTLVRFKLKKVSVFYKIKAGDACVLVNILGVAAAPAPLQIKLTPAARLLLREVN